MKLADLCDKDWASVRYRMAREYHLLPLDDKDDLALEVAKVFDKQGTDAGMGVLCAVLFYRQYGAARAALMGMRIYEELHREGAVRSPKTKELLNEMSWALPWRSPSAIPKDIKWPLQPPKWKRCPSFRGGMANVLFGLSLREEDGSTTAVLANSAVMRFLKEGLERKRRTGNGSVRDSND